MKIELPDAAYGFVINNKEIPGKLIDIPTGSLFFVSIDLGINTAEFLQQFFNLNKHIKIRFIRTGWINKQLENNRITIQFKLL